MKTCTVCLILIFSLHLSLAQDDSIDFHNKPISGINELEIIDLIEAREYKSAIDTLYFELLHQDVSQEDSLITDQLLNRAFYKIELEKEKAREASRVVRQVNTIRPILDDLILKSYPYRIDTILIPNKHIPSPIRERALNQLDIPKNYVSIYNNHIKNIKERQYDIVIPNLLQDERDYTEIGNKKMLETIAYLQAYVFNLVEHEKQEADRYEIALQKLDSITYAINQIRGNTTYFGKKFAMGRINVGTPSSPEYRYGYINNKGETLINFEFDSIKTDFYHKDGYARVIKGEREYLLDTNMVSSREAYLLAHKFREITRSAKVYDIHGNWMTDIIDRISEKQQLKIILAYGDGKELKKMSRIPSSITTLKKLEILDLHNNEIHELPQDLGNLTKLRILNVRKNQLTALPTSISGLINLESFDARNNRIKIVPQAMCALSNLPIRPNSRTKEFIFSGNPLTHIPDCYFSRFSSQDLDQFIQDFYHKGYDIATKLALAYFERNYPEKWKSEYDTIYQQVKK